MALTHKEKLSTMIVKWKIKGLKKSEALIKAKSAVRKADKRWVPSVQLTFDKAWKTRVTPQLAKEKNPKKLGQEIVKEELKEVVQQQQQQQQQVKAPKFVPDTTYYLYEIKAEIVGEDEDQEGVWICTKLINDWTTLKHTFERQMPSNIDVINVSGFLEKVGPESAFHLPPEVMKQIQTTGRSFNTALWHDSKHLDVRQLHSPNT
jgi:hypothetical protein